MLGSSRVCYCASLREWEGEGAPLCGVCRVGAEQLEMIQAGYVDANRKHLEGYRSCGVDVVTFPDHTIFVPCWTRTMVDGMFGSRWLAPILRRSLHDVAFRDAVLTMLHLSTPAESLLHVIQYAEGLGMRPEVFDGDPAQVQEG